MPLTPSLSDRLAYALDHYRRGDWTMTRFHIIEAAKEAFILAGAAIGRSTYRRTPPTPQTVASALRQLSAGLAALADAISPAEEPPHA